MQTRLKSIKATLGATKVRNPFDRNEGMISHHLGDATSDTSDATINLTLHSPWRNLSHYIPDLLDGAVYLAAAYRKDHSGDVPIRVNIVLHPVEWRIIKVCFAVFMPRRVLGFMRRWVSSNFHRRRSIGTASKVKEPDSRFVKKFSQGGYIIPVDGALSVGIYSSERTQNISWWVQLRSIAVATVMMIKCTRGVYRNRHALLLLKYKGVQIGDLAASVELRVSDKAAGRLDHVSSFALLKSLTDSIITIDYILGFDEWQTKPRSWVCISEFSYPEAIYRRLLPSFGVNVLDLFDYTGPLKSKPWNALEENPAVARESNRDFLSEEHMDAAREYLLRRIKDVRSCLPYMAVGQNEISGHVLDEQSGEEIEIDHNNVTVIVFLHDFSDAQYFYGVDCFADLFEWTTFSIEASLALKRVSRILIKGHPNIDHDWYLANRHAYHHLKSRYRNNKRVRFIRPNTSLQSIASLGRVIGITYHGSVAEEAVFLGIPVIASQCAAWSDEYPFVRTWSTKEEYKQLLLQAVSQQTPRVSEDELRALFEFITEYRFTRIERQAQPAFASFVQSLGGPKGKTECTTAAEIQEAVLFLNSIDAADPGIATWLRKQLHTYVKMSYNEHHFAWS